MSDIKQRVTRGALWTVLANGSDRLLGIVSVSILARLLTPGDFGLLGMGFAAIATIECLTAFGFDWALVRHPDLKAEHLNTAWTLRIIIDLIASLALVALAAPAASYFHEPRLESVVIVLAACKFVSGFENIGMVLFRRDLRFEKEFQYLLGTRLTNLVVVMPIAFFLHSYVALLAGVVATRLSGLAMSYILQPFRPRLSLAAHRELLNFSVWLQLGNILETIRSRTADFVLGRIVGVQAVAIYGMSNEIANLAVSEVAAPINRAVFSGYSTFADDIVRLREAYISVAAVIWLVCLPIAAGIACTAPQIVVLFLGPQWLAAIPVLQLLAMGGLASVVTANAHSVFLTIGRPAISTMISLTTVTLLLPIEILLTIMDGVRGAAIGYVATTCAIVPLVFWWLHRAVGLSFVQLAKRAWRPLFAAAAMVITVLLVRPEQADPVFSANLVDLLGLAAVGAAVFVLSMYAVWRACGRPVGAETQFVELALSMLRRKD